MFDDFLTYFQLEPDDNSPQTDDQNIGSYNSQTFCVRGMNRTSIFATGVEQQSSPSQTDIGPKSALRSCLNLNKVSSDTFHNDSSLADRPSNYQNLLSNQEFVR